jgi:hypothetical protein
MADSDEFATNVFFGVVIAIVVCGIVYTLSKKENFPGYPAPTTACIPAQMTPSPTMPPNPQSNPTVLDNVDQATADAYKAAYLNYTNTLAAYNGKQTCVPNVCANGTIDDGNCVCSNGTPYVHADGKIYCVPIDLSGDTNAEFDTSTSAFRCKSGFSQTKLATGDTTCYHTANTATITDYTSALDNARAVINAAPQVVGAYGKVGAFYISGRAVLPAGLTAVGTPVSRNSTAECATGTTAAPVPSTATFFAYNPKSKVCQYYSGAVALSSVATWTSALTVPCYTIGSTTL